MADHVRKHGIEQFINLYKKYKDLKFDVLKWGDEVNRGATAVLETQVFDWLQLKNFNIFPTD